MGRPKRTAHGTHGEFPDPEWPCESLTTKKPKSAPRSTPGRSTGRCLCGAVEIEIDIPAFWAWHDHGRASRRAHGAAYATYVGCWRKHVRVAKGAKKIVRYEDKSGASVRSFCGRCGTPLLYEKQHSPHAVNVPRALFAGRTGREPRYHLNFSERIDWLWTGEKLAPLKNYPAVMYERPKTRKRSEPQDFEEY